MKSEVNSSSPQIDKQGRRRLSKHKTEPTHRATTSKSIPWRLFFFPAKPKREPSSTANEDFRSPLENKKSPKLQPIASCAPLAGNPSSEHLIYIQPSSQLQEYQSVSCHTTEDRKQTDQLHSTTLRIYKTQSQWLCPATSSQASGLSTGAASAAYDSSEKPIFNRVDSMDPFDGPASIACDSWCEQLVAPTQCVGQYEHNRAEDSEKAEREINNTSAHHSADNFAPRTKSRIRANQSFQPRLERNSATIPPPPPLSLDAQLELKLELDSRKIPTRLRTLTTRFWVSLKNKSTALFPSLSLSLSRQDSGRKQIFMHQGVDVALVAVPINDACAMRASRATRRGVVGGNMDRGRGRKSRLFLDVDIDVE